eukprot:jgi/Botrbrau1/20046/Bobra.200_1s0051.1
MNVAALSVHRNLHNVVEAGDIKEIHDLTTVGDDLYTWRFKLKNFSNGMLAGFYLNQDLKTLSETYKQDHMLMEIDFPREYPDKPFLLRVVSPRCCWYTGHVTAGGSICTEMLSQSGSRDSWSASYTVENVLRAVIIAMLTCEVGRVNTPTGPGGTSGPLRIDLTSKWGHAPMKEYSLNEAQEGYRRAIANHGWGKA